MHKLHKIIVKIRRKIVQSIVNRNLPCYYKHKEKKYGHCVLGGQ